MTRAEELRKITNAVHGAKDDERFAEHKHYARSLVNGKARKSAEKGMCAVVVKIKKGYSQTLLSNCLMEMGFETTLSSDHGKHYVKIKW
jgi:hypothetical protein